jgi:hypothetical protein
MADIWKIDTCDSCQGFALTKKYLLNDELFVWCDDCADESATEQEMK